MTTQLEFLDSIGSEAIAAPIEQYDGPVPAAGDTVYLEMTARFRIVRRIFYYYTTTASLNEFTREMKVSLHCEPLPEGNFY